MAKALSVLVPFSRHHWLKGISILFIAEIWISLLCEGCRLYTVSLLHDGIRINFNSRRNSLGLHLLCFVVRMGLIHLLIKRLWRSLILNLIINGMLLVVIVIGSLCLSWPHMVFSFGLMCIFKHRITLIPKVLYFLRYGALFHRMVLVFTLDVLWIFNIDFCLVLYVGHLPINPLIFARPWRLILILRFLCRKWTLGL